MGRRTAPPALGSQTTCCQCQECGHYTGVLTPVARMALDSNCAKLKSSVSPPVSTMMTVLTSGRNPWDGCITSFRKTASPAPVKVPAPCIMARQFHT